MMTIVERKKITAATQDQLQLAQFPPVNMGGRRVDGIIMVDTIFILIIDHIIQIYIYKRIIN